MQHYLFTTGKKTNKLTTCLKLHNVSLTELLKKPASWLPSPACFSLAYNDMSGLLLFVNTGYQGGYHLPSPSHVPGTTLSPRQSLFEFSQYPWETSTATVSFWQVRKTWCTQVNNLSRVTQPPATGLRFKSKSVTIVCGLNLRCSSIPSSRGKCRSLQRATLGKKLTPYTIPLKSNQNILVKRVQSSDALFTNTSK